MLKIEKYSPSLAASLARSRPSSSPMHWREESLLQVLQLLVECGRRNRYFGRFRRRRRPPAIYQRLGTDRELRRSVGWCLELFGALGSPDLRARDAYKTLGPALN